MANSKDEKDVGDEVVKSIRALLDQKSATDEQRNAAEYDGVLGVLPEWFPAPYRKDFLLLRNDLLDQRLSSGKTGDEYDPEEPVPPEAAKKWVDAYMNAAFKTTDDADGRMDYFPPEFRTEIKFLAQLYHAFQLGQEKGSEFLLGEEQARHLAMGRNYSAGQSLRARLPRVKVQTDHGEETTITEIIQELASSRQFEDFTAPELWPEFYSKLDKMGLDPKDKENDDKNKSAITYLFRDDDRKQITFGRFATLVSAKRRK